MLGIIVEGVKKYVIHHEYEQADRLMMGDVKFLPDETPVKMPETGDILPAFWSHWKCLIKPFNGWVLYVI